MRWRTASPCTRVGEPGPATCSLIENVHIRMKMIPYFVRHGRVVCAGDRIQIFCDLLREIEAVLFVAAHGLHAKRSMRNKLDSESLR